MVAFEIRHYLKRKTQGKFGTAALKIDMSKAYDRIEWKFLKRMLLSLGFVVKFVDLVMICVTIVRYMVMHDGHEFGPINPGRGLRQGDPLSPYLFIICAEELSAILQEYEAKDVIHGCRIARSAPVVTHLFFADDSFLFFNAT